MLCCGASGTGKSRIIFHLIANAPEYMNPVPKKVIVFYQTYQPSIYDGLKLDCLKYGCKVEFRKFELITEELIMETQDTNGHTIYLYDDGAIAALRNNSVSMLLTHSRHLNVTIIFLTHTIFLNSDAARIASQQFSYYLFMKSPRMAGQVASVAHQIGKKIGKLLNEAYNDIQTRPGYQHILLDCTPDAVIPIRSAINTDALVAYI